MTAFVDAVRVKSAPVRKHEESCPTVFSSRVDNGNLSPSPKNVPLVHSEAPFSALLDVAPPGPSTRFGGATHAELVQSSSERSKAQLRSVTSIPFNGITSPLPSPMKTIACMKHAVEQEIYEVKVEKKTLVVTDDLRAAEIRTFRKENESLHKLPLNQEASSGTNSKRRRTGDIYSALSWHGQGAARNTIFERACL